MFRSNKLFTDIIYVLDRFCEPYYGLFQHVDRLLSLPAGQALPPNASLPLLAQALLLLTQLFQDLTCQDLPPFFEDHIADFMGDAVSGKEGWLKKYLLWSHPALVGVSQEYITNTVSDSRMTMMILQGLCRRYELLYAKSQRCSRRNTPTPSLSLAPSLTEYGTCSRPSAPRHAMMWCANIERSRSRPNANPQLVAKALKFLSVVVKMGSQRDMFSSPDTLRMFCDKIILPNMIIRGESPSMVDRAALISRE